MSHFIHLLLSIWFLLLVCTLHALVVARSGRPSASFEVIKNNVLLTKYAWNLNKKIKNKKSPIVKKVYWTWHCFRNFSYVTIPLTSLCSQDTGRQAMKLGWPTQLWPIQIYCLPVTLQCTCSSDKCTGLEKIFAYFLNLFSCSACGALKLCIIM